MKLNDIRISSRLHIWNLYKRFGLNPEAKDLTPNDRRIIGTYWEIMFCKLAYENERHFTPLQLSTNGNKSAQWYGQCQSTKSIYLLPDVVIWTAPGEHHEVKHKKPFHMDQYGPVFGLEEYRFDALMKFYDVTGQDVLYTIHNHDLTEGNLVSKNDITHWMTTSIAVLEGAHVHRQRSGSTLYNGGFSIRSILYWPVSCWSPLADHWGTKRHSHDIR